MGDASGARERAAQRRQGSAKALVLWRTASRTAPTGASVAAIAAARTSGARGVCRDRGQGQRRAARSAAGLLALDRRRRRQRPLDPELRRTFAGLAKTLSRQYLLSYSSPLRKPGGRVVVRADFGRAYAAAMRDQAAARGEGSFWYSTTGSLMLLVGVLALIGGAVGAGRRPRPFATPLAHATDAVDQRLARAVDVLLLEEPGEDRRERPGSLLPAESLEEPALDEREHRVLCATGHSEPRIGQLDVDRPRVAGTRAPRDSRSSRGCRRAGRCGTLSPIASPSSVWRSIRPPAPRQPAGDQARSPRAPRADREPPPRRGGGVCSARGLAAACSGIQARSTFVPSCNRPAR